MVVILFAQSMLSPLFGISVTAERLNDSGNIITDVLYQDSSGSEIDLAAERDKETDIQVSVIWNVDSSNTNVKSDTIILPEEVVIVEDIMQTVESGGEKIGTIAVSTDGQLQLVLDESLPGDLVAEGVEVFNAKIEASEISNNESTENVEQEKITEEKGKIDSANEEVKSDIGSEGINFDSNDKQKNNILAITPFADGSLELITENIIDEIRFTNEDGSEYQAGDFIEVDDKLRLDLTWTLENNHGYTAGDYFEFQLPKQLEIYNEINGALGDYGTYSVSADGKVTFTFNQNIEDNSNVHGSFWIDTEIYEREVTTTEETLNFKVKDEVVESIEINVRPTSGQSIHKEGQPVDGNFNAEMINWTVLVNTTRDNLINAVVTDSVPAGLKLNTNSIVVKEVEVDLSGNVIKEKTTTPKYTDDDSTVDSLNISFGDTNKAYKITYTTTMKESEKDKEGTTNYKNTAFLNSEGQNEKQSSASVSVERPKSLEKSSSNFNEQERSIEWTVKANFNEKKLNVGDVITDTFTFKSGENELRDIFEVVESDISIEQVDSFNSDGTVKEKSDAKSLFDIKINGNTVTYELKQETSKAFIIKYKTKAKSGAIINNDGEISNTVELKGKTTTSSQGVYQQVGKKSHDAINYQDKTIDWTIVVNADAQELKHFVLTDDFSESGQELIPGSVVIKDAAGTDVTESYTVEPIATNDGFKIDFGDINQKYTISYITEFTYDFGSEQTKPNFSNSVYITYETSDGKKYNLNFGDQVNPNKETKNNGVKNGKVNNETKEITWSVDINYNQLNLMNAKLEDVIPDNQSLIDGTVKIYETTIEPNGAVQVGNDVTDDFTVNSNKNHVNVNFGAIDQSYRVIFKTKDKDDIYNGDEVYENTAQFTPKTGETHNLYANVTLPNQGEFLSKSGTHNKEEWTADWVIDVNKSKSILSNVTVTDELGEGQVLLTDSFQVIKGSNEELVKGEDYHLTIDGNTFEISFPDTIKEAYKIRYSTYITVEETGNLDNSAQIKANETVTGTTEKTEAIQVKISTGGGTATGTTGGLNLIKLEEGTDRPLSNIAFQLIKKVGSQDIIVREGNTDEDGELSWTGLTFGEYTLKETVPDGYLGESEQIITLSYEATDGITTKEIYNNRKTGTVKIIKKDERTSEKLPGAEFKISNITTGHEYTLTTGNNGEIVQDVPFGEYTVEEVKAPNGYRVKENINNINIEIGKTTEITLYNEEFVDITGEKKWIHGENITTPDEITVQLLANGTIVQEKTVTAADDWKYSFKNLDKYNGIGNEINYSIKELAVDGYNTHIDGYDLVNIEQIDISGSKTWLDDNSDERPDQITVMLLANGEKVDTQKVIEQNDWKYTFKDLNKFDKNGKEISYAVEEVKVEGYKTNINGFDITNIRTGTIDVKGEKVWKDVNSTDRPESITVELTREVKGVADNNFSKSVTVKPDKQGNWKYEFTDLEEFNANGVAYTYKVAEQDVPEKYESTVNGYQITNVRIGKTEVSGTKRWKDDTTEARPESITVNLLRNNVVIETKEVLAEDNWRYSFTDLDKYDSEGQLYNYTVAEQDVPGYESKVNGYDITNTRSEKRTIEVTKGWLDDNSPNRPKSVIVYLYQNNELFNTVELKAENDWKYVFTDIEAFDEDGQPYEYSIKEKPMVGYETTIEGFNITNLRVGKTEVEGKKIWLDDNSPDRPESITVELFANGTETGKTVEVNAESNWEYKFTNLEKYDTQGKEINYTVKEKAVDGYKTTIDNYNITNLRIGKTEVTGEKIWNEVAEQYRPDSISVNLLADGKKVNSTKVSAETGWTYGFTGLDKYDDQGKEIKYTVEEFNVPVGYTSKVEGYDIINTQVTTEVTGEKIWLDDESPDRPDSITVELLKNGEKTGQTQELSADWEWKYRFTHLPKYDKQGKEIIYSVDEVEVPKGYEKSIEGNKIINLRVGTTSVEGTKTWKDSNSENRPDSIVVELLQNGIKIQEQEVTEATDWKYRFIELPAFDKYGKAYIYTVQEQEVSGYTSTVDGYDITNTLIPVSEENHDPEDTTTGSDNEVSNKQDANEGNKLPDTATNIFNLIAVGLGLLVFGFTLLTVAYWRNRNVV